MTSRRQALTAVLAAPFAGFLLFETGCTASDVLQKIETVDGAIQAAMASLALDPALAPYVAAIEIYLQLVSKFCAELSAELASTTATAAAKSAAIIADAAAITAGLPVLDNPQAQTIILAVSGAASSLLLSLGMATGSVTPAAAVGKAATFKKGHLSASDREKAAQLAARFRVHEVGLVRK